MKRFLLLTTSICLLSAGAIAQNGSSFSGTWTLDIAKSKLVERAPIESQVLTVTQTDKDIKVETATKRKQLPPDNGDDVGRLAGGGVSPDYAFTYPLDGKEVSFDQATPEGKIPAKVSAKSSSGKLYLFTKRTVPARELVPAVISISDTWELSPDGRTLTINRRQSTRFGTDNSTFVFSKK